MPNANSFSLVFPLGFRFQVLLFLIFVIYLKQSNSNEQKYPERQRFESLLAAGRSLALPISTGFILAIISNDKSNWNISQNGIESALGMSAEDLFASYSSLVKDLKGDDNVTMSNIIYTLREGWNHSLTANLDQLETTVQIIAWDNKTSNDETWRRMNDDLAEATNGILDGKLIPKETSLGSPFPFSTESAIISTFHYRNYWQRPWTDGGLNQFYDSGKLPFLKMEGEFLVSEEEDFTAVNIPLEGERKSVVFVLPKINITKYLRGHGDVDGDGVDDGDEVPFPKTWHRKDVSILIPNFNVTSTDQYGKELEEVGWVTLREILLGMNETFCTTLHDRRGRFPFYMRPIVQVNAMLFGEESLEIASATGTAVEKFYFGLDVGGKGYPKLKFKSQIEQNFEESTSHKSNSDSNHPDPIKESKIQQKILFDKPFLFYLNDEKIGPMFYGMIQKLQIVDGTKPEKEETSIDIEKAEVDKFFWWSCKSFKQSGDVDESIEVS